MRVSFICLGSVFLALFGYILISLCIADSASSVQIHWYIMTSPFTDEATRKFFESHKFFGLEAEQVRCLNLFHVLLVLVLLTMDLSLWYRLPFSSKEQSLVFPRMVDLLWRLHTGYTLILYWAVNIFSSLFCFLKFM